jgi:16S rRNA processing protein RimM
MRVGRVGRAHGLDGSFHVIDARPELLSPGLELLEVGVIVERKGSPDRPIIRIDTAADRTAAEELRGRELNVDEALRPPLEEDEYLAEDLEGCRVVDGERALGVVARLLALPSCEVLELDTGLLVPLVRDAVRVVDVEAKRIEVDAEFLGAA